MTGRILFGFLTFFFCEYTVAQKFSPQIQKDKITVASKTRLGYSTSFDESAKTMERAWWSYSRQFGRPLNMRGYYKVTVPATLNEGTVDLELFSKAMSNKTGSRFYLSLNTEDLPSSKVTAYNSEVKKILQSFKRSYYINLLEENIEKEEKKAIREGKKAEKSRGRSREKALQELADLDQSLENLKTDLKSVYQAYQ